MKTIPELSVEVMELVSFLKETKTDQVVKYSELSEIICADVQCPNGRSKLASARRILQRREKIQFEAVWNVGLRRVSSGSVATTSMPETRKKMGSLVNRQTHKLRTIANPKDLSKEETNAYYTAVSMLGVLAEMTKVSRAKEIETKVRMDGKPVNVATVLQMFKAS